MNNLPEIKEGTPKREWDNKIWRITMECADGSQFIVEAGAIIEVNLDFSKEYITSPWENNSSPHILNRSTLTLKIDMTSVLMRNKEK